MQEITQTYQHVLGMMKKIADNLPIKPESVTVHGEEQFSLTATFDKKSVMHLDQDELFSQNKIFSKFTFPSEAINSPLPIERVKLELEYELRSSADRHHVQETKPKALTIKLKQPPEAEGYSPQMHNLTHYVCNTLLDRLKNSATQEDSPDNGHHIHSNKITITDSLNNIEGLLAYMKEDVFYDAVYQKMKPVDQGFYDAINDSSQIKEPETVEFNL